MAVANTAYLTKNRTRRIIYGRLNVICLIIVLMRQGTMLTKEVLQRKNNSIQRMQEKQTLRET